MSYIKPVDLGQDSCYYQTTAFQRMDLTPSSDVKVGEGAPSLLDQMDGAVAKYGFIYLFAVDLMALFSNLTI
jgi:hypothetical protein